MKGGGGNRLLVGILGWAVMGRMVGEWRQVDGNSIEFLHLPTPGMV